MWYNSLWLWRWLPHRLSKRPSLSITTVLFRTTFTRTIILNLLMKWLQGSNLSQYQKSLWKFAQFPSVSLRRTPFELALSFYLREMIGSQIKGLRKAEANFRYPFYRSVRFTEVSVKRESTVYPNFCDVSDTFARFNTQWRGELVEESQDLLSSNLLVSTVSYKKSPLSSSTMLCGQSNRWCNSCFYEKIRRWKHVSWSNLFVYNWGCKLHDQNENHDSKVN